MYFDKFDLDIEEANQFLSKEICDKLFQDYPDTKVFKIKKRGS